SPKILQVDRDKAASSSTFTSRVARYYDVQNLRAFSFSDWHEPARRGGSGDAAERSSNYRFSEPVQWNWHDAGVSGGVHDDCRCRDRGVHDRYHNGCKAGLSSNV